MTNSERSEDPPGSDAGDSPAAPLHLWLVNEYATNYPNSGFTRHHLMARAMRDEGVETTIFAGEGSGKGSGGVGAPGAVGREGALSVAHHGVRLVDHDGVCFAWLPVRTYSGNGLGRVLNMAGFALSLLRRGWNPQRAGLRRPDVVVGSDPQPFATLAGYLLARRHRVPFVLEVRDIWPASLVQFLGVPRLHPFVILLGGIERLLYRHSDRIIGIPGRIDEYARTRFGAKAAPVTWIPNGVAVETLPPAPTDAREQGPEDPFVVIYAGAHGPPNNLESVLGAAEILQGQPAAREIRFDLYGTGVSKPELVRSARDRGLSNVHFHDPVPKTEIVRLIGQADLAVLTLKRVDLFRYGISPNKLFDYFAASRPVIVTLEAADDPVIRSGGAVRARPEDPADLADRIRQVAALTAAERADMGRRGREYVVANHDMRVLGARFAQTLRDAVAGRRARRR